MKRYQNKIIAIVLLGSFALASCSVQYRERHRHHDNPNARVIIHN